jgi:carbonic anhydrase/acetyltransferase-like protein (isoleucine patch superfamily)
MRGRWGIGVVSGMIVEFDGYTPLVAESAFVAPTAVLVGNVVVEEGASVWYGAVLRADHGEQAIVIGAGSNVQDNCVIHVSLERGTTIGRNVTIGHGAILEACAIEDGAVIGMNAVVLEHARIGRRSMVAAGSTVLAHTEIPDEVLAAGSPAVVKKPLEGDARWWIEKSGTYYGALAARYRKQGLDGDR